MEIESVNEYSLSDYSIPDIVLDSGNILVNKMGSVPALQTLIFQWRQLEKRCVNKKGLSGTHKCFKEVKIGNVMMPRFLV